MMPAHGPRPRAVDPGSRFRPAVEVQAFHEIVGRVIEVGSEVKRPKAGECHRHRLYRRFVSTLRPVRKGEEQLCRENATQTY